jgi:hypothetical protein
MNIEIKKLAELLVSMVIGSSQLEGPCYLTKEDRAEMIRKTEQELLERALDKPRI